MKKSILSFVAVLAVIALLCCTAVFGLNVGPLSIASVLDEEDGIRRGLDLVGGSSITFEAILEDDYDTANLESDMASVQAMMQKRLDSLGYTEATVELVGDRRVKVDIPAINDPAEAVSVLGATAQLKFVDADGNTILDGSGIQSAKSGYGQLSQSDLTSQHYVEVTFKEEAVETWTEATKAAANAESGKNTIKIMMDDEVLSEPSVSSEYAATGITGDTCVISGSFTAESAKTLAEQINIGQLPFSLEEVSMSSVGPQLGERALTTSIQAGAIGLLLVMLFMILFYRLPGVVASIALLFYTALDLVILSAAHVNLSLPGIAGIILSIGMAVDANVVIFERMKEELRNGKTIRAAIDSGFHRAFAAILDSNVTTLIAAFVLYFMGTGTVKGFAITLGIGVVLSMFTAVVVTHFLLNRMADFRLTDLKFYGVRKKKEA
ncbi:MAG TPA: protein translocase subunit SecD [Candidatus Butyricicoccus stercorigallinarum]|nr:protein translocase subunit SecD [Candidatus Butyricicoccus stercorigallinarum]